MPNSPAVLRTLAVRTIVYCLASAGLFLSPAFAGHIEDRGDKTIVHGTVFGLPDPGPEWGRGGKVWRVRVSPGR